MSRKNLLRLIALFVTLAGTARSQTTFASITGTVTDPAGALVPNAVVTATNVETNIRSSAQSNEAGVFTIPQLKEGTYTVRAEAPGFRNSVFENVRLVARDARRLDIKLDIGDVTTAVEVQGGATLIETETARISDTKNSLVLNTIPTNSRSLWANLNLSPGLQGQDGSSVTRFAGSRVNENNWSIDGTTFSDGVDNTQTGPLANYIESFQEVKIDLSNNSAEFGSLGQVTVISKSGTNQFHGSLFDYYSTPMFRAKGFFDTERSTGIVHLPGGSVGGPVLIPKVYNGKDKTFFFFSFETSRGSAAQDRLTPTVAPSAWRTGDFSGLGTPITDPGTGQPFPGNTIPANRINPVSQKIQDKFFPLPNFGDTATLHTQNYRELKIRPWDPSTYWTTRIDHKIARNDQVFGRYTWSRGYNRVWEGNLPTIGQRWQQRDDRAATVSYTHSFRPNLLNEIRWGFGLNNNPINYDLNLGSTQHGLELVNELGLVGLAPDLPDINGILNMTFSNGMTGLNQAPWRKKGYRTHTEEFQEHISWFRGRHNFKFGFNLLRAEYDDFGASGNLFGNLRFTDKFTGNPYADFLLGIPTTASRAFPPIEVDRNRWSYDFYAMDDYKISPKLTLNIGVRYELHLNWRENHNLMSLFDVTSGKIVIPDGAMSQVSPIYPANYVGIAEASSVGFDSRKLIHLDRNNFAPRIGLAWRPWGNNTVLRAGWGMFYNVVPLAYSLGFGDVPFVLTEPAYTNPLSNPQVVLPRVFPASGTGGPDSVSLPMAQNPDYKTPYSMQYNFTIERQQWNTGFRASYIGTAMRKGPYVYDYNSPVPDARPFISKPRPFPDLPAVSYVTNGAGHQYNGLTLEATRQLSGGLYFQSSWTWARDRYDLDYNWDFDSSKFTSENPFDRRREVGPAQEIPTHRFTSNFIYRLPFGKGRHFASNVSHLTNLLVGGWEISGIYTAQSGQFLTPFWTGPDPVGIAYTTSDPAYVTIRPDILANPNLPGGQQSLDRWFDTGAFAPPADGRFGTSGKGVIKGPGVNVWSGGLGKDFVFSERARLRWEMTASNLFNHPNWQNPGTDITDTTGLGVITSDGGVTNGSVGDRSGARAFRMGLRLQF
jgi:hypothetical protein